MTIIREDVEDLGRLGDKEVTKVVEEFEARLKVLKENHTKELEVVKSTLSDNHKNELENHEKELEMVEVEHKKEIQTVKEGVKKALEAEHLKKFTAVSKQIESLQRAEVENLRVQMTEERERIVRDIKESHRLELQELERKYCEQPAGSAREITPEVARALREDLSCLEAERNHLKSMQVTIFDISDHLANNQCCAGANERAD